MARQPKEQARFEVLLEQVLTGQQTIIEGHRLLHAKLDHLEQRLMQHFDRLEAAITGEFHLIAHESLLS